MKKTIILIISFTFILAGCSYTPVENDIEKTEYVKSIWLTYYELSNLTKNNNEQKFTKQIEIIISDLKDRGFNRITVQVRPCADAFYNSQYFPLSTYFKGKENYDTLKIICDISSRYNIDIEAWVNPYRVSQNNDSTKLDESFYKKYKKYIVEVNKKLYFNPAYKEVNELIINGVNELVENYNIKAIHFDDYFYPEKCGDFDLNNYNDSKTELTFEDWRRENVNELIKGVSEKINHRVEFGISPASNIKSNYNNLYADIQNWIENDYIDYVCPQIYFGFKNEYQPFMQTVKKWIDLCCDYNIDLYIGLPLYKSGRIDEYASSKKEIQNEFIDNDDIIKRQITYLKDLDKIKGYYIFSYSSINDKKSKNEVSNMYEVMQDNNQVLNQNPLFQQ